MSLRALRAYSLINNKDLVNVDDPHIFVCNKAEVKYLSRYFTSALLRYFTR